MADLVILVPMLGRPHTVEPLRESVGGATPDARVLWLLTPGDDDVLEVIKTRTDDGVLMVDYQPGDFARKINAGIAATTEPLIFTGACDLRFHKGWYEACLDKLKPGIGVVGTNDLGNLGTRNGGHATHFLVTRSYVDEFGTIDEPGKFFHEGYPHEFCDNEAYETARGRGRYAHARDAIVEHLHPLWGKAPWDPMYEEMTPRIAAGRKLFALRRSLWPRLR